MRANQEDGPDDRESCHIRGPFQKPLEASQHPKATAPKQQSRNTTARTKSLVVDKQHPRRFPNFSPGFHGKIDQMTVCKWVHQVSWKAADSIKEIFADVAVQSIENQSVPFSYLLSVRLAGFRSGPHGLL